jgi:hypothetical protein
MADRKSVPAVRNYASLARVNVPRPSIPSLRYDSGAFALTDTRKRKKDAEYTRADADLFDARREQTNAMSGLIDARIALALKLSELAILPELLDHHYHTGRRDREHEAAIQRMTHETAETNALIELTRAQQHLVSLQPAKDLPELPAPATQLANGLSVDDVEQVLQQFPELNPETIRPIILALGGVAAEKRK